VVLTLAREKSSPTFALKDPRSSALVSVPFEGWFKRYRTRMNAEAADENLFFSLSALSALVRVPFEGWFKRYRTRMNAEAADENLFFFIRVIGARPRPQVFSSSAPIRSPSVDSIR
jgi:hypothetical protein